MIHDGSDAKSDVTRLGVLCVYDPSTGLATRPVAAVAWSPTTATLSWIPCPAARSCRCDLEYETASMIDVISWLEEHEDPGGLRFVEELATLAAGDDPVAAVDDLVDDLIAEGEWR